jgi:DNA-binding MarR family transcriptional regulator
VLLVDNLQLVFERIAPIEQHALRELLMRPGSPILIGASPSPPPESQDYGAAFYDHFKIHYLRPLSADEMRELMLKLAEITGRSDVRDKVLAHPQRLKTLRDLTGGNPRTVVTLFFLYAEDFSPSVFADLENLLDRVTPLYKARIEELAEQQQVVVSAVADHWAPVTARGISEATGLPMASISGQLDRLEKTGFVEKGRNLRPILSRLPDRRTLLQHLVPDAQRLPPAAPGGRVPRPFHRELLRGQGPPSPGPDT